MCTLALEAGAHLSGGLYAAQLQCHRQRGANVCADQEAADRASKCGSCTREWLAVLISDTAGPTLGKRQKCMYSSVPISGLRTGCMRTAADVFLPLTTYIKLTAIVWHRRGIVCLWLGRLFAPRLAAKVGADQSALCISRAEHFDTVHSQYAVLLLFKCLRCCQAVACQ